MEVECFRWKKALTRLILWKPYIFSCLTKLENCRKAQGSIKSQNLMRTQFASQSLRLRCCV
jgi:hypothetical protein